MHLSCTRKVRTVGRRLFVGNLPYETGEAELEEMFGKIGPVDSVRVMRDMATGRARGFAFVEMASDDDAQRVQPAALLRQQHRRREHAGAREARGADGVGRVAHQQP